MDFVHIYYVTLPNELLVNSRNSRLIQCGILADKSLIFTIVCKQRVFLHRQYNSSKLDPVGLMGKSDKRVADNASKMVSAVVPVIVNCDYGHSSSTRILEWYPILYCN